MPFLIAIALTCAALSATFGRNHGALESGRLSRIDMQRNPVLTHRHHAARVQDLGAVARNLLRLVVMQRAQQPRRRYGARVGAEHARHVGPNLQARRRELGGEIRSRGIRAAAPEQHRLARIVRGDESLRDDDLAARVATRLAARNRAQNHRSPTENPPSRSRSSRGSARNTSRASTQSVAMPWAFKKAAPKLVASNSPIAMMRARMRSSSVAVLRQGVGTAPQFLEEALEPRAGIDPEAVREISMRRFQCVRARRPVCRRAQRPAAPRADR